MRGTTRATVQKARTLRRRMSPSEVLLWQYLRASPGELKFRRQHPIGRYVADFYCPAAKLVIEVDGDVHDFAEQARHDEARDEWMKARGYRVLRIPAAGVHADVADVVAAILAACRA